MTFRNLTPLALPGGIRQYQVPAAKVIGYPLDGYFAIIEPPTQDVTNVVANPSLETNTTFWNARGTGTIARDLTEQRFGAASLKVTPGAAATDGTFYDFFTLLPATWYRASIWFKAQVAGYKYAVAIFTTGGLGLGTRVVFTSTGEWQYVSVLYYETAAVATNRRFYIVKDTSSQNPTNLNPFWVDGLLVTSYYQYPMLYFDGDSAGYLSTRNDFYWTGTPHGSTSVMRANTRAGGYIRSLGALGFTLLATMGLGMANPDNVVLPLALPGGEQYQDTLATARTFDLVGMLEAGNPQELKRRHSDLASLLDTRRRPYRQEMTLLYEELSECGDSAGELVIIQCSFAGGLEGVRDNHYREDLDLRFRIHLPYVGVNAGSQGAALNLDTTLTGVNYIIHRDALGTYSKLGTGGNAAVFGALYKNGIIYAAGSFTLMDGVANTARIAKYDTATGVWTPLGTGSTATVNSALAMDALGNLYVVGSFSQMGGVAGTTMIAKWNGSAWVAMGTGVSGGGPTGVFAVLAGADNRIYAGGLFGGLSGVANTANLGAWTGSAWVSITPGGSANGIVRALAWGPDNNLYVTGSFTSINGQAINGIAKYNPITGVWTSLGTGIAAGYVTSMVFGPDGTLYVGGTVTSIGGQTVRFVAYWNGYGWSELGTGITGTIINRMVWNRLNNLLYISGNFTAAGGVPMPDSITIWNGSQYLTPDVDLPGSADVYALAVDETTGAMVFGFSTTGTATAASTATTLTNSGTADTFPIFKWIADTTGTDSLQIFQISNQTTGENIYFTYLRLMSGETITFDFRPGHKSITSDFQGDLTGKVAPGSNMASFHLAPGPNVITVFQRVEVGNSPTGYAYWYPAYAELEDTVR